MLHFPSHLDPCEKDSYWKRYILTERDYEQQMEVLQVNGRWQITINGHVRSSVAQLRFNNTGSNRADVFESGNSYEICSSTDEIRRGVYRVRTLDGSCQRVYSEDLMVDFPADSPPPVKLSGDLPSLSDFLIWAKASKVKPLYRMKVRDSADYCAGLPVQEYGSAPVFAKTTNGEWLQFYPRLMVRKNSITSPLPDGGLDLFKVNVTTYCANAPRSYLNEEHCFLSTVEACSPGDENATLAQVKTLVCGGLDEVDNDPGFGDNWLDVHVLDDGDNEMIPPDLFSSRELSRQREFIWSEIALKSLDQLRQRAAWALFQIFALPKDAVGNQSRGTQRIAYRRNCFSP